MKTLKFIAIAILSIVGLLGLTILLSATVFKDELIECLIEQEKQEQSGIKAYFVSELPVEPENFAEDFKSIHKQVVENCSLYKHKDYNIDSIYTSLANRIGKDVKTKADYGLMLCEYFASLNIGHAGLFFKKHHCAYIPTAVDDRLFISTPEEHIVNYGFRDKDEIISINGTPIKEYVNNHKKYVSASTNDARILLTQLTSFISYTDTLLTCDVFRNGERLALDLPLKSPTTTSDNKPLANSEIINNTVGYISIESMSNGVVDDFKQAYQQVRDLPYLIVDIRKNGGGNSGNGRLIAEYLVCNTQKHCVNGEDITPQPDAYKGKLFLLTSNYTFSAAESFAIDLKESGNATLVGEATAGDTGCRPQNFISKYGIWFRIPTREPRLSPKGHPMEGVGIEPHYKVKQTVADFFNDKDTAVEYILNNLITE